MEQVKQMNGWNLGGAISEAIIGLVILAFVAGLVACGLAIGAYHLIAWLIP